MKKILQIFKDLSKLILFSPFVLILRVLSRRYPIRFKSLFVNRIGHEAAEFGLYCIEKEWIILPQNHSIDLFYYYNAPANTYLMQLMKRKKKSLYFPWFFRTLHYCNAFFPGHEKNDLDWKYKSVDDSQMLTTQSAPLFRLTPQEAKKGERLLEDRFGCTSSQPIVCFFNRDNAYLKHSPGFEECDFSYHDYRDSSIKNYQKAIEACSFLEKYTFFRMGKIVVENLNDCHPNIIEYANSPNKSDFLDVYLIARAKFLICTSTGLGQLGTIFRKKIVIVNMCPLLGMMRSDVYFDPYVLGNLMIFKKYYSKTNHKLLNVREILNLGAHVFGLTDDYDKHGITLIENTAHEIKDLAEEMEMRLNGEWEETPEDRALQNKFWDLVGLSNKNINRDHFPKIGTVFLRENAWLLE